MSNSGAIPAVFEDGCFKPERSIHLPDRTRVLISLRRVEVTAEQAASAQKRIEEISRRTDMRLKDWRFNRDELYERR